MAEIDVGARAPPRAVTDAERNAIDDFPCAALDLLLRKLFGALGFANALPRGNVVPSVSRANADESLIVFRPRFVWSLQMFRFN